MSLASHTIFQMQALVDDLVAAVSRLCNVSSVTPTTTVVTLPGNDEALAKFDGYAGCVLCWCCAMFPTSHMWQALSCSTPGSHTASWVESCVLRDKLFYCVSTAGLRRVLGCSASPADVSKPFAFVSTRVALWPPTCISASTRTLS